MSLAGNQTLRQYEQSMLPPRPEIGRNESSLSARCKVSRRRQSLRSQSPRSQSLRSQSLRSQLTSVLGLLAPLLLLAQVLTSCGSDDDSKACNAGDLHPCTCSGGVMGSQICKDDNSGYEDCSCDGTASVGGSGGGGGSSSTGGSASGVAGNSSMAPAPFGGEVGSPCTADSQCAGAPLVCIKATSNTEFQQGGPQGGYCSLPCGTNDDCTAVDDISACNTTLHYCFALCIPGMSQVKCGSDRAQACVTVNTNFGVCIPRCSSDAACGAGRFCDPGGTGLCVDAQVPGGKVGDPCTPATEATDCAGGVCLQYADPNNRSVVAGSFCSGGCTFGLSNGCGFDNVSGGKRQAACLQASDDGGQPGDIGLCFPLCDSNADCAQSGNGWVCNPFNDVNAEQQVGRLGECLPAVVANFGVADAGPG